MTIGGLKGKQFWFAFWAVFFLADSINCVMHGHDDWWSGALLSFISALLLRPDPETQSEQ
jgi:hypothetical protein